jgi:hypothetical protein
VVVRGSGADASLRNRTPRDIVQAVNTAMGDDEAVAARTMHNGDVVVTFRTDAETKTANTD